MKVATIALGLSLSLSLTACKKKEDAAPAPGPGSAGSAATATPAPPRPSQSKLPPLPALELPDDPQRDAKIALGNALFFDKRLSVDGSLACYSCHQNEDGTGGHDPIAIGPGGKPLKRHSPVLWNVAYYKNAYYHDGRAATLEDVAKAAWGGGNMGVGTEPGKLEAKTTEVVKAGAYDKQFAAAFGAGAPTPDHVAQALAAYMRTMICNDTGYDRWVAGDKTALTEVQQRGLDTFMGKGGCATCHTPPFFTAAAAIDGGLYFNAGIGTNKPEAEVDVGRMAVTKADVDWAAFRPPTLRNITKSPPYFHDGSGKTLEEAVTLMATGGLANKAKSPLLTDRGLTQDERGEVTEFLGALTCGGQLTPPAAK